MNHANAARLGALILLCSLTVGCASAPERSHGVNDPLEPLNRRVHAFNDVVDRNVLRPVAKGYNTVLPEPVNRGVSNFFSNLDDVSVLVNSALQFKPRATAITANRLLINTTFGLAGLIDVADMMGAEKHNEDFGQTLGYWGIDAGPYLVLPLLGPSSVRDGGGRLVDAWYDPIDEIPDDGARNTARVLQIVDGRAGLIGTTDVLETAAIDSYGYTRDAWLRRRVNLVHDGDPPPEALPDSGSPEDEGFDPFSDEDDDLFEREGS